MLHLIGLESIETRYTKEWKTHLPETFRAAGLQVIDDYYGDELQTEASPGGFLNWTSTQYFKSSQMMKISEAFASGKIKSGDVIFFADFWNPAILQTRYIAEMTGTPVKIVALAHAGSYDPYDMVSRNCSHPWVRNAELAMTNASDVLFFATDFHKSLFQPSFMGNSIKTDLVVAGFPMEYVWDIANPSVEKEDLVLFTQRNAIEKQPHLFDKLAEICGSTKYKFVNVQALGLDKVGYHNILNRAKLVVSFANQETLGITPFEALVCGCDILVPDRLSYKEMYSESFKYDSNATIEEIANRVLSHLESPNRERIASEAARVGRQFFSSNRMTDILLELTSAG